MPFGGVAGKLRLNRIPKRLIDDRRVAARMRLLLVNDFTPIDAVLQHQIERAACEWFAAPQATEALVRNLLWMLRASNSCFNNRTEPSSAYRRKMKCTISASLSTVTSLRSCA